MNHYDLTERELEIFVEEVAELLDGLDGDLVRLDQAHHPELVRRIFRAFHTLKGGASSVGHHPMAELTHRAETVLARIRDGQLVPSTALVTLLVEVTDVLRRYLDDIVADRPPGPSVEGLLQRLQEWAEPVHPPSPSQTATTHLPSLPAATKADLDQALSSGQRLYRVQVHADPAGFAPQARLLQAHTALAEIGRVLAGEPDVAVLEEGQGGNAYTALMVGECDVETLRRALEAIDDLAGIEVSEVTGPVVQAPSEQVAPTGTELPPPQEPARASTLEAEVANLRRDARFVRTRVERLDNLLNLAGELVTDRNRLFRIYEELAQHLPPDRLQALNDTISHLSTVTDRLHEEIVAVRMQPIGALFGRMPRVVRQLARELGKEVELVMGGQDTEVDRSVIEHIADPLLHLIRNAIDHGIEPPQERTALGKPAHGRLVLQASSEDNHIVITIADDGRGIDADRVREKAVALGLLSREEAKRLSYEQAIDLVFAPGLSTAEMVSGVSGRGVGMDVVRSNLQRLNGSVDVRSVPGQGTTFELRMPLTLAILPALLAQVDDHVYAVPLQNVLEILKVDDVTLSNVRGRTAAYVRGEFLPLYDLDELLGNAPLLDTDTEAAEVQAQPMKAQEGMRPYVVSVFYRDLHFGLLVDRPLGKEEVVLKALRYPLDQIAGLAGATLLGDGRIGLIVDMGSIGERLNRSRRIAAPARS